MAAPVCPKPEVLKRLIKLFSTVETTHIEVEDPEEIANALRYLENFLSNRRGYQRKNQIKRKLIWKAAEEAGLMNEIDDAVAARFGKETIDDVTDEEIEAFGEEEE